MFGTISSALVLSTARVEGLAEFTSSPKQATGPGSRRPFLWLRALDMPSFPSARRAGPLRRQRQELSSPSVPWGWCTSSVRRTVQVLHQDDNTSALGTPFAFLEHINAQVRQAVESSSDLRQAILSVDHAPAEVMLTRWCADVSTNCLRFNGDWLDHSRSTPNSAKPSARP